jgi:hypothetical protein
MSLSTLKANAEKKNIMLAHAWCLVWSKTARGGPRLISRAVVSNRTTWHVPGIFVVAR